MDERVLEVLEYPKILDLLAKRTSSTMGRELAVALKPSSSLEEVQELQQQTSQAVALLNSYPGMPLGGVRDIRTSVKRAMLGIVLLPEQLLDIAQTLYATRRAKKFINEVEGNFTLLQNVADCIVNLKEVEDNIYRAIGENGEVKDEASSELSRIRRSIRNLGQRVRDKMEAILRSPENQKLIQEALITIRDDRYVIPVKQECRGQFPGIVHDQSSSGATVYIEPMPVVSLNNDLKRELLAEKTEIERILTVLSNRIAVNSHDIEVTLGAFAQLDLTFAKARLSQDLRGIEPILNSQNHVHLVGARHPLIGENVVPISLSLGKEISMLIVTGPNTGGKTVTLKTTGLFALMCQAGLHIPAQDGSEMPVFSEIFADIGDEQSIEQSLSTFSGHMTNLIDIISRVDKRSLVLIDEVGAGTDPNEGSALAMAILEYLYKKGARVIATTHYSELKTFAYAREGVENASVEFDLVTLRPTYKLLIGIPGKSNAFAIAARLGLSGEIVNRAKEMVTTERVELDQIINKLTETQLHYEQERVEQGQLRRDLEQTKLQFERLQKKLTTEQNEIMEAARIKARDIVQQTKRDSDTIIAELKEVTKQQDERARWQAIHGARTKLGETRDRLWEQTKSQYIGEGTNDEQPVVQQLLPGETVFLPQYNQTGHVVNVEYDDQIVVQVGIMKVKVPLSACRKTEKKASSKVAGKATALATVKQQAISPQLDLRGTTVEEAEFLIDKYLDDAYLAGLRQVTLVHGKGTGALRKGVKALLASHPRVKSQRLGGIGEGGDGVTVVEVK